MFIKKLIPGTPPPSLNGGRGDEKEGKILKSKKELQGHLSKKKKKTVRLIKFLFLLKGRPGLKFWIFTKSYLQTQI